MTQLKNEEKKILASHLMEAMDKEELNTRETARCLNLNPCYVSMFKNYRLWDSCPRDAWCRLTQWHDSRLKLKEYQYPEDEPKWEPKAKDNPPSPMDKGENTILDLPETKKEIGKIEQEKSGKSVKLVLNQAEMKQIQDRIAELERKIEAHVIFIKELQKQADEANTELFRLKGATIPNIFYRLGELEKPKEEISGKPHQTVIFQRNIYNPKS